MKTNDTVNVDWLKITPIHKRHTDTTKTCLSNNEHRAENMEDML